MTVACGSDLPAQIGRTEVRTRSGSIAFAGTTAYVFRSQSILGPVDAGPDPVNFLDIEIHESPEGCGAQLGIGQTARSIVSIALASPLSQAIKTGRYPVAFGPSFDHSWAGYVHQEEVVGTILSASSGALDLVQLSDTTAQGSIDLTLQDGTQVAGEFSAGPCP